MKNLLTCDIIRRTYMSHGTRQRCSQGRATQSGAYPPARAWAIARGGRTPGSRLVRHQAPGLSLSPACPTSQTTGSRRRRQSIFYREAFSPFSRKAKDVCRLDRIDAERDRQSSGAVSVAAWGRPWLTAGQAGHARCGGNINLIGCPRRNWPRFTPAWCRSRSRPQVGQLSPCPDATRRC